MNSYERMKAAVTHQTPDRVPCDFSAEPEVLDRLLKYFNLKTAGELLRLLQIDRRSVSPRYIGPELKHFPDGSYETIVSGGPIVKDVPAPGGTNASTVMFPWADVNSPTDLEGRYGWTGHIDWWDFSTIPSQIDALEEEDKYWITTHGDPSGLQHLMMWVGDERFLTLLGNDPDLAVAMIEKHNQFRLEHALRTLEAGGGRIHELQGGGDYGTQLNLLISPSMFRKYFKQLYLDFYGEIKRNFDVEILFHSCGAISKLIPELIEVGVTILDPIQVSARGMDLHTLKQNYGNQITFHGAIDVQQLLPYATVNEVRLAVRQAIDILGENGGYILSPSHNLQSDTSIENILAIYEEAQSRKIMYSCA